MSPPLSAATSPAGERNPESAGIAPFIAYARGRLTLLKLNIEPPPDISSRRKAVVNLFDLPRATDVLRSVSVPPEVTPPTPYSVNTGTGPEALEKRRPRQILIFHVPPGEKFDPNRSRVLYFDTAFDGESGIPPLGHLMSDYRVQGYAPRAFIMPSFGPREWVEWVAQLQSVRLPDPMQMAMRARVLHAKLMMQMGRDVMPITIEMNA